jgi:hypothetical protein
MSQSISSNVFGWRLGRVGTERTRSRSYLDEDEEGWVGPKGEYSSQMQVRSHPRNPADEFAPLRANCCVSLPSISLATQ